MKPAPATVMVSGMGAAQIIQPGDEQSVVRYLDDGTEQVVPNTWFEAEKEKDQ